jgi:muramoyltetrapeptide carboxypeptidase LdcA involved in peptidoglycan recycling
MLIELKNRKILGLVRGIIVGKPHDEQYYEEYKDVYRDVFKDLNTPVLYNVNFGHSVPRCIIPYNAEATVDYDNKKIFINTPFFEK